MNKNLQEPTALVSARRRLVRGAFAAPVALSLYSGSAFAAASMSCLAKEVTIGKELPESTVGTGVDTYIRVQLHTMTMVAPPQAVVTWINGADLIALKTTLNASGSYLSLDQWQCFQIPPGVTFPYTAGQTINGQPSVPGWGNPIANGRYVAVRMDQNGNITGVAGLDGSGYAVHQSCWASFKPT